MSDQITRYFAYVTNNTAYNISAYSLDTATGALTKITGSPFYNSYMPTEIKVNPSSRFAYVANSNSNSISGYSINNATGALAKISGSPFAAGTKPWSITIHPSGNFV